MNLIGAASSAGAATMIVCSRALFSSRVCASATTVAMRWPIATYTETTPLSRLLMIVSIAIAVLPVCRSPMISSRWPRPIGVIASIAFRPVCIGCGPDWRCTTPGALNSAGRVSVVAISPFPSKGRPSGSTIRPSSASPTGMSSRRPVRFTVSPSTMCSHLPISTGGSSSTSKDMQFSKPCNRAMPSATDRTVPTSVSSADPASSPSMRLFRMLVISSGLICMSFLRGSLGNLPAQLLQSVANRGVQNRVPDPQHDAAQDVGVHARRQRPLASGALADALAQVLGGGRVQLNRARDLHRQHPILLLPQALVLTANTEDHGHAVILDQQLQEVHESLIGSLQ